MRSGHPAPRILRYITRPIETLRPGDYVLTRDEHDPDGDLVLRQIEEVFARITYQLHFVTLRSSGGVEQTITTTAEHPVYALGHGWIAAGQLEAGTPLDDLGGRSTVTACRTERHPEGVKVV